MCVCVQVSKNVKWKSFAQLKLVLVRNPTLEKYKPPKLKDEKLRLSWQFPDFISAYCPDPLEAYKVVSRPPLSVAYMKFENLIVLVPLNWLLSQTSSFSIKNEKFFFSFANAIKILV
jgi:hypothetical protein